MNRIKYFSIKTKPHFYQIIKPKYLRIFYLEYKLFCQKYNQFFKESNPHSFSD